jgi:ubiquinone/menaquinone biosynthesis C-methylase UbiE
MPDSRKRPGGSLNFDRVAECYDETRGGEERGDQFGADLAKLLRTDRPVLEIGVGTGVIALALQTRAFSVFGVDISEQMLAAAVRRIGPRVARADAMQLPFPDGSLDQAVSVWVLHAAADPARVMREVVRCLSPGGRYLVMDTHFDDDADDTVTAAWREVGDGLGRPPMRSRYHEWAELAPKCGLEVPPGTAHRFTNASDEQAVIRVEVNPALNMEELFETTVALAKEGRTFRSGLPKPLELALFMREFEQEVQAPIGAGVVRAVTAPLAGWRRAADSIAATGWPTRVGLVPRDDPGRVTPATADRGASREKRSREAECGRPRPGRGRGRYVRPPNVDALRRDRRPGVRDGRRHHRQHRGWRLRRPAGGRRRTRHLHRELGPGRWIDNRPRHGHHHVETSRRCGPDSPA